MTLHLYEMYEIEHYRPRGHYFLVFIAYQSQDQYEVSMSKKETERKNTHEQKRIRQLVRYHLEDNNNNNNISISTITIITFQEEKICIHSFVLNAINIMRKCRYK
jgi:hypothetical protein